VQCRVVIKLKVWGLGQTLDKEEELIFILKFISVTATDMCAVV
jgi:hypothetical protein